MFLQIILSLIIFVERRSAFIDPADRLRGTVSPIYNKAVPVHMARGLGISDQRDADRQRTDLFVRDFTGTVVGCKQFGVYEPQSRYQTNNTKNPFHISLKI